MRCARSRPRRRAGRGRCSIRRELIGNLDRDKLYRLLDGIDGLEIPATLARDARAIVGGSRDRRDALRRDRQRSCLSHHHPAARLACRRRACQDRRCAGAAALSRASEEQDFFVSRFVDYSSDDGLFRKYPGRLRRRPALCLPHGDRRSLGHLVSQRRHGGRARRSVLEEADLHDAPSTSPSAAATGRRSRRWPRASASTISSSIARRTKDGALLIFEADNTAVVHNMDPPSVFPYKPPQMRKIFDAFAAMLERASRQAAGAGGMTTRSPRKRVCASDASETLDPQDWDEFRALGHRMLDDMIDHIADDPRAAGLAADPRRGSRAVSRDDCRASAVRSRARSIANSPISSRPTRPATSIPASWAGCMAAAPPSACSRRCWRPASTPISAGAITCRSRSSGRSSNGCARLFGFPAGASGIFVTGTSMANLMAVLVARTVGARQARRGSTASARRARC